MSSLSFMSRAGEAAVSGREYIKFGGLLVDLVWRSVLATCDPHEQGGPSVLRDAVVLPRWVTIGRRDDFARNAGLFLRTSGGDALVSVPGRTVGTLLDVAVNTVLLGHVDLVALAVRLYAQADVNAWVDGPDRKWLADLIDRGRCAAYPPEVAGGYTGSVPLFADEPSVNGRYDGWAGVVEHLRASDRDAIVLSYSVSEGFPSRSWAGCIRGLTTPARRWWDKATPEQQWDASERGLRQETVDRPLLQITPDNLHDPMFGTNPATWPAVAAAWRDRHRKDTDPS